MRHLASLTIGAGMLVALSSGPATSTGAEANASHGPTDAQVVTVAVRCYRSVRPAHRPKPGKRRCLGAVPGFGPTIRTPGALISPGTGIVTFGNGPGAGITTFGRNRGADPRPGTGPFGNLGGR